MLGTSEIFSKKNLQHSLWGFYVCWRLLIEKLQLTFPMTKQKTVQNAPFKKTNLNQQHRKEDDADDDAATHSLH